MKIEKAIEHFEYLFRGNRGSIEQNPCEQPLRTDVDIVECYTGGVIKKGERCPALATTEADAVRLWWEAARDYYFKQRSDTFHAYLKASGKDHKLRDYDCKETLVWRVKPELECLPFKYFSPACDPHEAGYDAYVDVNFWRVRARFGIRVNWAEVKLDREPLRPTTACELSDKLGLTGPKAGDEAVLRAIGAMRR